MKAQRDVWGQTLVDLARSDSRVALVDGDLATSTKADLFAEAFPERFFEIGIAEQNMVGVAFGLSTLGYRPWLSTFGVFLTHRALDPIRMLVSQTGAPVKIAASYAGLLNGSSGKTHQDIEDLAIMRAMPGMTVIAPADAEEAEAAIRWSADYDGPVYIRLARDPVADVFDSDHVFVPGAVHVLREGGDAILVSTGVQTSRVMDSAELLTEQGLEVRVVHVPCLKPVDEPALLSALSGPAPIFTIEEHSVIGGLGGLVSELVTSTILGESVTRLGLADSWSESAPNAYLLDKYGLSAQRVAEQVRHALADD
ncbi:transketolase family protein [Paenarthrobacter ureafaciens]|uniref:transketolase family protein n=1 Tax=Paenarthrobacter ureafaciens TaxID=37931 RepID=UPI001407ED2B|nr:transketolase C-terminal domain-containing protein [Paenarthrobacter ureafaciens]MCX8455626.1 transketolase family protein [Paenarthrobacter ureafaciens]MCY0973767.1 transketolase family protein [Paenarthrobacter ureafaciens]